MKPSSWIDVLHNIDIDVPFKINYDNEYYRELKQTYKKLELKFRDVNAPDYLIEILEKYSGSLIYALDAYYRGDIIESHNIVFKIIEDCCKDNDFAISDINNSIAFPKTTSSQSEVQFFRARLNENIIDYPAKQMLHIPFNNRALVRSERFSIPGLPCLYLGNTSYVCWIEMGKPADYKFNVSPIRLDNSQRIFNLTVTAQNFYNIIDLEVDTAIIEHKLGILLKLYLLKLATSFNVLESGRNFKSEYIISQMIMLACKKMGLNGIIYYSKKVESEIFARACGINLALFADFNGEEGLSQTCKHLKIGDSFNFAMFKQLLPSLMYKHYDLRIDQFNLINNIGSFKRQFPYRETQFYLFDEYLFANWDNNV